ncbi:MAG: PqqD family protein [Methylocystis sp.]|nr:PqqD family protein [Methylocystis sp.]
MDLDPMTTFIARSPKVAARMLGDEMMIVSARESSLYTLNETAAAIWNGADGVTPLATIVERHVGAVFDVDCAEAMDDALTLVKELRDFGVMCVFDAPVTETS